MPGCHLRCFAHLFYEMWIILCLWAYVMSRQCTGKCSLSWALPLQGEMPVVSLLSVSSSRSSYHVPRPSSRGQLQFTWLRQFRCNGGRTWTVDTGLLGVTMAMSMQTLAKGQQVKWKQIQFSEDWLSPLLNYCLINFCLCLWLNVLMRILNQ